MTTRTEALRAMESLILIPRDRFVYAMLLHRADNDTCEIPDQWQPASLADRKVFGGSSRRTVARALAHLRMHGWVQWKPLHRGREGRPSNRYELSIGSPCDCPVKGHAGTKLAPVKGHGGTQPTEFSANLTHSFVPAFSATSQVRPPIRTEGIAAKGLSTNTSPPTTCIGPGCPKPPRRSCRTCWEHAPLELTA